MSDYIRYTISQMSVEQEKTPSREIQIDTLPYAFISGLHHRFEHKIFNPQRDSTATARLVAKRKEWADRGEVTIFTSGVFDLLHLDHAGYLLHTKAAGASIHFTRSNQDSGTQWEHLAPEEQQAYISWALGNQLLRLVVSVDGDKSVAERKSGKPQKGGYVRPVYSWQTRALMVASQAFVDPLDESGELLLPTVDAVTIHGSQDFNSGHVHASHFQVVDILRPDAWVYFGESVDIPAGVPLWPGLGSVALCCIEDNAGPHYFEDDFIGKLSTTTITKRILGT